MISLDSEREMRSVKERLSFIEEREEYFPELIGERENEALRSIREELKSGEVAKSSLFALKKIHFALVQRKVCATLCSYIRAVKEVQFGEKESAWFSSIADKLEKRERDQEACSGLFDLITHIGLFKNEGAQDEIAIAHTIGLLTSHIFTPSPLYALRQRADAYYFAEKFFLCRKFLAEMIESGGDVAERYLQNKEDKYGLKGPFSEELERAKEEYRKQAPEGERGGLSDYLIKKTYRRAFTALRKAEHPSGGVHFSCKNKRKKGETVYNFLAARVDGELLIARWSGETKMMNNDKNKLGEGSSCSVEKSFVVTKQQFGALKIATSSAHLSLEKSNSSLYNEVDKLGKINSIGVVEKPWFLFQTYLCNRSPPRYLVATIGKLYNLRDLYEVLTGSSYLSALRNLDRAEMALQLFTGLSNLHKKNIIHGDIKVENILVDYDSREKVWRAAISDFGDARYTEEFTRDSKKCTLVNNLDCGFGTMASYSYFTYHDMKSSKSAKDSDEALWRDLQKKRDVFALATTVWQLLTGDPPFLCSIDPPKFPLTHLGTANDKDQLIKKLLGENFIGILKECLSEYPLERPSALVTAASLRHSVEALCEKVAQ